MMIFHVKTMNDVQRMLLKERHPTFCSSLVVFFSNYFHEMSHSFRRELLGEVDE